MSSAQSGAHWLDKSKVGGIKDFQPLDITAREIWNKYEEHLTKKIQDQFRVPKSFTLKPVLVAEQCVAGTNYFFKIELPGKKYATARVYHVPWQSSTHGKAEQVNVHETLHDNPNIDVGWF